MEGVLEGRKTGPCNAGRPSHAGALVLGGEHGTPVRGDRTEEGASRSAPACVGGERNGNHRHSGVSGSKANVLGVNVPGVSVLDVGIDGP